MKSPISSAETPHVIKISSFRNIYISNTFLLLKCYRTGQVSCELSSAETPTFICWNSTYHQGFLFPEFIFSSYLYLRFYNWNVILIHVTIIATAIIQFGYNHNKVGISIEFTVCSLGGPDWQVRWSRTIRCWALNSFLHLPSGLRRLLRLRKFINPFKHTWNVVRSPWESMDYNGVIFPTLFGRHHFIRNHLQPLLSWFFSQPLVTN